MTNIHYGISQLGNLKVNSVYLLLKHNYNFMFLCCRFFQLLNPQLKPPDLRSLLSYMHLVELRAEGLFEFKDVICVSCRSFLNPVNDQITATSTMPLNICKFVA
jgi:hypothetical protein